MSVIIIAYPCSIRAGEQTGPPEPRTELETFLSKTGRIIVKEFHSLGKLDGTLGTSMQLTTLILYEPGKESQRQKGLRIEIKETAPYERSEASFLDVDEMESLSKAIDYMINLAQQWAGKTGDYTDVTFSTKGNFHLGFYVNEGRLGAFAKSGSVGSASAYFPMPTLQKVKETVDSGLAHLNAR